MKTPDSMNPSLIGQVRANGVLLIAVHIDSNGVSKCTGCGKEFNLLRGILYPTTYVLPNEEEKLRYGYLQYCTMRCCLENVMILGEG